MGRGRKPLREEDFVNAEGSGAAALLLFSHIAVVGYVAYCWWFLFSDRSTWAALSLRPSVWQFYMVPWFGILTFLPTDKLTSVVGRCAQLIAGLSLAGFLVFGLLGVRDATVEGIAGPSGVILATFMAALPGVLLRIAFASAMPLYRGAMLPVSRNMLMLVAAVGLVELLVAGRGCGWTSGVAYGAVAFLTGYAGAMAWNLAKGIHSGDKGVRAAGFIMLLCAAGFVGLGTARGGRCLAADWGWALIGAAAVIGMLLSGGMKALKQKKNA